MTWLPVGSPPVSRFNIFVPREYSDRGFLGCLINFSLKVVMKYVRHGPLRRNRKIFVRRYRGGGLQ